MVPQIRDPRFGRKGNNTGINLREDDRYTMIAIYHGMEDLSREGLRLALRRMLGEKILAENDRTTMDWWKKSFVMKLLHEDCKFFAAEKESFVQFKNRMFFRE